MALTTHDSLNDFPRHIRGTFRLYTPPRSVEDEVTETMAKKLEIAKDIVKSIATENETTLLLHCSSRGYGWLMMWWPANEPRHEELDEIITPGENNG
jgi:hypothetical protein